MSENVSGKSNEAGTSQNAPQNVNNELNNDNNSFTIDVKSQVEQLIKSAQKQCDKEKRYMQDEHRKEILHLRTQILIELNKAFETNLVIPLKEKINGNENEIRTLRNALQICKEHEEKLEKEKNALQNQVNIYKMRNEKLEIEKSQFQPQSSSQQPKSGNSMPGENKEQSTTHDIIVVKSNTDLKLLPTKDEKNVAEKEFQAEKDNTYPVHRQQNANPFIQYVSLDPDDNTKNSPNSVPKTLQTQVNPPVTITGQIVSDQNPTYNVPKTVEERLQIIEFKLQDIKKIFFDESATIQAMFLKNEVKYAHHISNMQDEIAEIKNVAGVGKKDRIANPETVKNLETSIRQLNFVTSEDVGRFDPSLQQIRKSK